MQDLDFNMYPEKVVMEWDQYDSVDQKVVHFSKSLNEYYDIKFRNKLDAKNDPILQMNSL